MWERGLKPDWHVTLDEAEMSLPMWERGLKQPTEGGFRLIGWSLPMWERGLKHLIHCTLQH